MRRKVGFDLGATALVFLLSSCFALQSFTVLDYIIAPGQKTTAQFVLRPMSAANKNNVPRFVIVGVPSGDNLTIGKATWGTNGTFKGPVPMAANGAILTSIGTQCEQAGLNFADVTGTDWKAFLTPENIPDGGKTAKKAVVQVSIKAAADASTGVNYAVVGVSGDWLDDGDDAVGPEDGFVCFGIATSSVLVKAA